MIYWRNFMSSYMKCVQKTSNRRYYNKNGLRWHRCNLAAKESGLECVCVNNDDCTSQWGRYIPPSEHVAMAFKTIEQVEQQICIKFCGKLGYSSAETTQMIQKAAAMGNWWLAASLQQHAHSCVTSRADFFGKTSNHPGDSATPQPRFGTCGFQLFPKLKSPLKGKRFQTRQLLIFRKIPWGSWWQFGELCEVPRCPLWRRLRCHCPMYSVSCIFFNKCLFFIVHGWILSGQTSYQLLLVSGSIHWVVCSNALLWPIFVRSLGDQMMG